MVKPIHRVTRYRPHPIHTSPWDDNVYAFEGNVLPGNFINMVLLPDISFEVTPGQRVPTMTHVPPTLAASTAATVGPFRDVDPDTELLRVWRMVQVPPAYVRLVMRQEFSPRRAWEELAGAILANGNDVSCTYLLNWFCVALTLRKRSGTTGNRVLSILLQETSFPALAVDKPFLFLNIFLL